MPYRRVAPVNIELCDERLLSVALPFFDPYIMNVEKVVSTACEVSSLSRCPE